MEDGGNVGGIEVGSEELRAEEGESGEIRVGEALGFEEMDGGEDLLDGIGRMESGSGIDDVEGFEVTEVLMMCSAEVDEWKRKKARSGSGSVGGREGRDGGEWSCSSNRHGWVFLKVLAPVAVASS